MNRAEGWSYSLPEGQHTRIDSFNADRQFEDLCQEIAKNLKVLCCHETKLARNPFKESEIARPVFTIKISSALFDQFFNSVFGYRAAYFISPGTGFDANERFMIAVTQRLIDDPVTSVSKLKPDFIRESLKSTSAKVWIAEQGKEPKSTCDQCKGEWGIGGSESQKIAEIQNGRWETASCQNAEWGRQAPFLTKLRIMGAFLNVTNPRHEIIPDDKRQRASSIHENGWS